MAPAEDESRSLSFDVTLNRGSGRQIIVEASYHGDHMTFDELRAFHRATPFRPLTVRLVDGRQYAIPRREFLSHHPHGRTVVVFHEDDSASFFDLAMIKEIKLSG